jgi:NADH:ubiquinone oxidoreductase subunit 6 (subunit J)
VNMNDAVFIILGVITLFGAVGVVSFNNIVHAAISLVISFLGVAGLYFQLQAEFLGLVQVIVYAGAISVLIIFAIMLVMDRDPARTNLTHKINRWWGGLIAVLFAVFIGLAIRESPFDPHEDQQDYISFNYDPHPGRQPGSLPSSQKYGGG